MKFVGYLFLFFILSVICLVFCVGVQEDLFGVEWLVKFVGDWEVEYEQGGLGMMISFMFGKYWIVNEV